LAMLGIFIGSGWRMPPLTREEQMAVASARAMHASLWEWLNSPPVRLRAAQWAEKLGGEDVPPAQVDPGRSGLIGVEWSEITTTLGPLAVKQATADPLWAAHILRWFDKVGLTRGDRVMIFASGSFPGFLVSALAASEIRELQVELTVSLGSSTWGANRMEAPWPLLEQRLRQAGHLRTQSRYYTPGGRGGVGGNYSEDAFTLLEEASAVAGVPFLKLRDLNEVILMKTDEIREFRPQLIIFIGGGASVMGGDTGDTLPSGLIAPGSLDGMGQGVARAGLAENIPVLHLLNVRELSKQIAANSKPSAWLWQAAGLICFFAALITHRRWAWREDL